MMTFTQLNGKKVLFRLLINLLVCSIIVLIGLGIMKKHDDPWAAIQIMAMLVYGFGLSFFLIYFFGGHHAFRVSRKLFSLISSRNIFDDKVCFIGYLDKDSRVFYTQECLCGYIDGYPVIVTFELAMDKGQTSELHFGVISSRFKRPYTEQLTVQLNWLHGYEPKADVTSELHAFMENLKSKSTPVGSFDAMVAEKRFSIPADADRLIFNVL